MGQQRTLLAASPGTDASPPAASSNAVSLGSEEERRNVRDSWERILRWARLAKECVPVPVLCAASPAGLLCPHR